MRSLNKISRLLVLLFFVASLGAVGCAKKNDELSRNVEELFSRAVRKSHRGQIEDSAALFKSIIEDFPLSEYALESQLMLADLYYKTDRFDEASSYYTSFAVLHPAHIKAEYALFQKGMSHFKLVLSINRDQTETRKALFAFEDLMAAYPKSNYNERASEMIVFLRERLAGREFAIGSFYYKDKNYKGALVRFKEILDKYSDTTIIDKSLYFVGLCYLKLGEDRLAGEVFSIIIKEFPESPFVSGAKRKLKKTMKNG